MSQTRLRPMTAASFLDWAQYQETRFELVDGQPKAMTGARQRHDRITANALGELHALLRGKPCRTFTADLAVLIPNGNVRRPDVGVHCGPFRDDALTAEYPPRLVIEVLSPSTRTFDLVRKLDEYRTVVGLDAILLVDPDVAEVILWSRESAGSWRHAIRKGLDAAIDLPMLGISLTLAALYDGLAFRPRLVEDGEAPG